VRRDRGRNRAAGQSLLEFIVVSAFIVIALCSPWLGGRSPAGMLLESLAAAAAAHVDWLKVI